MKPFGVQPESGLKKKKLFKIPELARLLGISPQAVHIRLQTGSIRHFRRSSKAGHYLILRSEVIRLLKQLGREIPGLWTRLRKRVLVIDDYAPIRRLMQDAFRDPLLRLEIRTAGSAEDGLVLAGTFRPHVIVVDHQLHPDRLQGDQAIALIRRVAALKGVKLIAMSSSPDATAKMIQAGADASLQKPFGLDELRKSIYMEAFGNRLKHCTREPMQGLITDTVGFR